MLHRFLITGVRQHSQERSAARVLRNDDVVPHAGRWFATFTDQGEFIPPNGDDFSAESKYALSGRGRVVLAIQALAAGNLTVIGVDRLSLEFKQVEHVDRAVLRAGLECIELFKCRVHTA